MPARATRIIWVYTRFIVGRGWAVRREENGNARAWQAGI
jgi:hypothetical protein